MNIAHQVKSFHVDEDVAEEPPEHFAEGVGHQPDKPQLQVLRHLLQNGASVLSHLLHSYSRLCGNLGSKTQGGGVNVDGTHNKPLLTPCVLHLFNHVTQKLGPHHSPAEVGRGAG